MQALGACVGIKINFTMIADVYSQVDATKKISRIAMAFAIMPGLAIATGGWLTKLFGWESCFYFLSLFGVFVLWLSTRLPETAKSLDLYALKISSIFQGYRLKFKNRRLVISALMMGCGSAVIYVFASKSPFIGMGLIGLTPEVFGNYNLIPLVGMFLGCLLAGKLAGRLPLLKLLCIGTLVSLALSLVMFIPFAMGVINVWSLFLPVAFIYLAESLIFTNVSAFGLSLAKNKSNGSAVMNFINLSVTVIAVLLLEFIYPESALLMPLSFIVFFFVIFVLWLRLRKMEKSVG